jgi:hypothetical protein
MPERELSCAQATSLMVYANGTKRPFARRERPSLLLDEKGFPLVLYNGIRE